jgi:hypothetical protein
MEEINQDHSGRILTRTIDARQVADSHCHSRVFGHFTVHVHGHSLGDAKAGRRFVPTGSFSSVKAGVAIPWVRHPMRALVHVLECHTDVCDYRTFPHRLDFVHRGKPRQFIPDVAFDAVDGSVAVAWFPGPDRLVVDEAANIYAAMGWTCRLLDESKFDVYSDRARALQRVLDFKDVYFTSQDTFTVRECLSSKGGVCRLEEVAPMLGGGRIGVAKLCAMSLRRIVVLRPMFSLDPETWVTEPNAKRPASAKTFKLWEN